MASKRGPRFDRPKAIKGEILLDDATRRRLYRIRWRRIAATLGAIGLVAAMVGLYFSPLLRVQEVEVVGAVGTDPQLIADMADLKGQTMLYGSYEDARAEIAELPNVKSVAIERRWPQTVRIVVTERAPWGTWLVGETPYVIDDEGYVLEGIAAPDGSPMVRTADSAGVLRPGDRVDADAVQLTRALLEQVPARFQMNIAYIEWSAASGLTVTTDAAYRVVVGDSQNMDYKLAVWQQIEADLGREAMNGHVLDLRFGDRPSFQ